MVLMGHIHIIGRCIRKVPKNKSLIEHVQDKAAVYLTQVHGNMGYHTCFIQRQAIMAI